MSLVRRVLFVAWQDPVTRRVLPVGRLVARESEPRWEYAYIEGARLAAEFGFVPFQGMSKLDGVYRSETLPPFFENRLMQRKRPDFPQYMDRLGLPQDLHDEIPILARSEGRRATDTIELFGLPTYDADRDVYRFMFFARGVRHLAEAETRIGRLTPGDVLDLQPDPANPVDRLAIQVHRGGGGVVGYVPNTLVEDVRELQTRGSSITVFVHQVNPSPAPVQLRLLCKLEATRVDGYVPFGSDRYQPIPDQASRIDIQPSVLVA
jgi:hypothetical protein